METHQGFRDRIVSSSVEAFLAFFSPNVQLLLGQQLVQMQSFDILGGGLCDNFLEHRWKRADCTGSQVMSQEFDVRS